MRLSQVLVPVEEDPVLEIPRPCDHGPMVLEGGTIGVPGDDVAGVGAMEVREAGRYHPGVLAPLFVQYPVNLVLAGAILGPLLALPRSPAVRSW